MAINLYDSAYDLEKAIRNSSEYSNLKKMYDEVNNDESARRMFENFRNIQMQLQEKQMMGQEITQEEVEQAQKTVALVQQHEMVSKLMEAEQRMSMVIAEMNQIIMKPLEELYGNPDNQQ
ncbi:YlbF family regulator [Bacillus sp. REN3]|uniref:YlbF family regulator n=1 Tax=Bacillus sp. REN3 TaxID=2802440 RepID=UPI001AEE837C|nr:YlbF family regulator [Bacillus sp. REN3]